MLISLKGDRLLFKVLFDMLICTGNCTRRYKGFGKALIIDMEHYSGN